MEKFSNLQRRIKMNGEIQQKSLCSLTNKAKCSMFVSFLHIYFDCFGCVFIHKVPPCNTEGLHTIPSAYLNIFKN